MRCLLFDMIWRSLILGNVTYILQGYFTGNGTIGLPQCQQSKPERYVSSHWPWEILYFGFVIFKLISMIYGFGISCEITLR